MDSKQKSTKMTNTIKEIVAEACGLPVSVMEKRSGKRNEVEARQIAMYMIRRYMKLSYKEVLHCFPAIENHTSIIYAVRVVENLMSYDKRIMRVTSSIIGRIYNVITASEDKKKLSHYTIFDGKCAHGMYETEKMASSLVEPNQRVIPVYV